MFVDASELDQRVWIQRKVSVKDPDFQTETFSWVDVVDVFAKVVDEINPKKGGDELVDQNIRVQRSRTQILIRYQPGITSAMRVRWPARDRIFQITSIAEKGRREGLEFSCEEYSS